MNEEYEVVSKSKPLTKCKRLYIHVFTRPQHTYIRTSIVSFTYIHAYIHTYPAAFAFLVVIIQMLAVVVTITKFLTGNKGGIEQVC